jgi:hypothetical protein
MRPVVVELCVELDLLRNCWCLWLLGGGSCAGRTLSPIELRTSLVIESDHA